MKLMTEHDVKCEIIPDVKTEVDIDDLKSCLGEMLDPEITIADYKKRLRQSGDKNKKLSFKLRKYKYLLMTLKSKMIYQPETDTCKEFIIFKQPITKNDKDFLQIKEWLLK